MSGENPRRIIAGTKTQTRRVVRPEDAPILVEPHDTPNVTIYGRDGTPLREWYTLAPEASARLWWLRPGTRTKPTPSKLKLSRQWDARDRVHGKARWSRDEIIGLCPYGLPGDRLWVRERWAVRLDTPRRYIDPREVRAYGGGPPTPGCQLRAHSTNVIIQYEAHPTSYEELQRSPGFITYRTDAPAKWWNPMFMPRWASRLTLEITEVRVQRLQDISEDDARAEGVTPFAYDPEGDCWTDGTHRTAFEYAWNEIHGWNPNTWDLNPWCWCLSFKRVEAP